MTTYKISTDAVQTTVEAKTIDAAAAQFAKGEGIKARNVAELSAAIRKIEGAWLQIDADGVNEVLVGGENRA